MIRETATAPLGEGAATQTEPLDGTKIATTDDTGKGSTQWAKVPESVAYMGLDATALNVLIIIASKAGRDRTAWITQQTMAERLEVSRTTIRKAIGRLEKLDLVRKAGKVVVDHERGTWVQKYNVAPYLPVGTPWGDIGSQGDVPDVTFEVPDVTLGLPDVTLGRPDGAEQARLKPHSVPQYQSLSFSPSVSVTTVGEEKQERPQERNEEEEAKYQEQIKSITRWLDGQGSTRPRRGGLFDA